MLDRLTIERMMAWTGGKPVLVALSGGGDSVALLHLLNAELGAARLRAVVVDHALRYGSADDAKRAAGFAEALDVGVEILTLTWEEGANRAQQAARQARYKAICEFARAEDLNTVATAHTADDQAETVIMRAANGSTWRGLGGIAPLAFAPLWPEGLGIALARPLLGTRREELRTYLRDRRAAWIEDPANLNSRFERVRVRQRLAELEADGLDPSRLVRVAKRLRARGDALDTAARELIAHAVAFDPEPEIRRDAWHAPAEVRCRALSALITAAAGASREPAWTEMKRIEQRVMCPEHRGSTHAGVDFTVARGGVTLLRELGAVVGRSDGAPPLAPLALPEGEEVIWDGRVAITALEPGWRAVPARSRHRLAFESDQARLSYKQSKERFRLRFLAPQRVAHAFAPDINRAKP
ncbi:MAG: tRNA lysidine(34) synthetase TilS [Hyphomonadaceae bacterium]